MNVTLFPVAAFLLLLSGLGAPAHTVSQGETSAALMRVIFGKWDGAQTASRTATLASPSRFRARVSVDAGARTPGFLPDDRWSEDGLAQRALTAPGAAKQKQYKTRFGFADGAYLALGPPICGPQAGPNGQLS